MSKAGIQSNRGDGYQTLVAFEWALTVLDDPMYEWLEVDAATLPVDDVVIGKTDGSKICCQCKKNQALHKAWSVTDLAEELQKASELLTSDPKASVRFYSRSPFGELATLRECSTVYPDEASYLANLGQATGMTDAKLKTKLTHGSPALSTYDFLRRTTFDLSPELDRMETLLRERLRRLASNPDVAFNALWTRLDLLGMRSDNQNGQNAAIQHRLTKADLQHILDGVGSMLAPPMNLADVRSIFESTSSIGREWRRDIAGETLETPLVAEILTAIDSKPSSILLTGQPGSGKTCVMLALQEALEQQTQSNSDRFPIFIQSREFADLDTAQDRQAQGLPQDWVERAARMAETAHVVVVIDSLDVLSIAREHKVLDYFLAQMDRLLRLSNITVVTACRDFDRQYDRRIAQRKWSREFKCRPLNWTTDIAPLLTRQNIDASAMDEATRQLIENPRELDLYVELARKGGSFNVVTSQALAQRYLDTIVQANDALGNVAMRAIEAIALEMLRLRSLSVPPQRLETSDVMRRALLSHNVLQKTQDGKLMFGHQTLLDVLVISDALRQGKTLHEFIQDLPPVPFVRPSIRSFIAQLAIGERRTFRKQLRVVLTGNHAFHIRRLVAESFAEQIPQDDDWPLIRDLRATHRDVFQVIYTQGVRVEWHHFWFKHLVPALKNPLDLEGLTTHVHRVSQWKNEDAVGVLEFWVEVMKMSGVDKTQFVHSMAHSITQFHAAHTSLLVPLLLILLEQPQQEHSFLGHALAHCMKAADLDDAVLWRYITREASDEDVLAYRINHKLRCLPHEFGESKEKFLADRMQKSTALLDLAIASIEQWSQIKRSHYGDTPVGYWHGFLSETSYNDTHSQTIHRYLDAERILMDAIESAIVHHANTRTDWWKNNRERLCFSTEGALRYFAILACTASRAANLDVISRILCDKPLLESELSHELGTLMQTTFSQLDTATQDTIQTIIPSLYLKYIADRKHQPWVLKSQAQFILTIPCHLRSPTMQMVLDECEKSFWPLERQPDISMRSGAVNAPFSFQVLLSVSDSAVMRLLAHYNGYERNSYDDFLIGGEREVGSQLRESASRHPTRFLKLLPKHWMQISKRFRDDILDGVANYLNHRHGNFQPNGNWSPIEEPDAISLSQQILDELERHPTYWHHNRAASNALQACSHVIQSTENAERLVFLALGYLTLNEKDPISGDSVDLLTIGINMARGHVIEALMIVATELKDHSIAWPELLAPTLHQFAAEEHPAIRALLLRRLPYLQSLQPDLGWELFDLAMQENAPGLWALAEPCLYYTYHQNFDIVNPWLARLGREGQGKDLETWGRISALAALSKQIDHAKFLSELTTRDNSEAWRGAASVWTNSDNMLQHRDQCLAGLQTGMSTANSNSTAVARECCDFFRETVPLVSVPTDLIRTCFTLLESETDSDRSDIFGFDEWLNATSIRDPMSALEATEVYLCFVRRIKGRLYDHGHNLTQLLTRLFAQAEEQEESDGGVMLQRVVGVQDSLLALGVNGVNDWLKAVERP